MNSFKVFLFTLLIFIGVAGFSEDLKFSKLISVYDGDTFIVQIDDLPKVFGQKLRIRVAKIDTPEVKSSSMLVKKYANTAKVFSEKLLTSAHRIELKNVKRDKYFRVIADVYVDGVDLAEELLKEGLAVKYSGGKRVDWVPLAKKYFESHPIKISY
jgi:micrococcal nuclease